MNSSFKEDEHVVDTHRKLKKSIENQIIEISKQSSKQSEDIQIESENYLEKQLPDQTEKITGVMRFTKIKYYQQYFKVSEKEVEERINSAIFTPWNQNLIDLINKNADFYGPFWIMTTIILLLILAGNFSNYILSKFIDSFGVPSYFFKLNLLDNAMILVYSLGVGIPASIHFYLKFLKQHQFELPSLICLYGYSLSPTIIVLLICAIVPVDLFQDIILLYSFLSSTLVLLRNIMKNIVESKIRNSLMLGVTIMQAILFICFKALFFQKIQFVAPEMLP